MLKNKSQCLTDSTDVQAFQTHKTSRIFSLNAKLEVSLSPEEVPSISGNYWTDTLSVNLFTPVRSMVAPGGPAPSQAKALERATLEAPGGLSTQPLPWSPTPHTGA